MADDTSFSDDLLADIKKLGDLESRGKSEEGRRSAAEEINGLDLYQVAANSKEERDPKYVGEIEGMLRRNDSEGLRARLGEGPATRLREAYGEAWRRVEQDRNLSRSPGEVAKDVAVGIPATMVSGILGLESLVMGSPVGEFLLDWGGIGGEGTASFADYSGQYAPVAAEQNRQLNEQVVDPQYSATLKNQRKLVGLLDRDDERDHRLQAEDAADEAGGEFLPVLGAWTGRVAKDAFSGAENTLSNPVVAAQGTTDAIGSMLLAGGVTKGLGALGEKVVARKSAQILEQQLAKGVERTAAEKLAADGVEALRKRLGNYSAMGGVGVTEAGGAYQQQTEKVMATSLDDLTQNSWEFRDEVARLEAQGVSFEDAEVIAQRTIANKSGQDAALKTGVVSAGIGRFLPEGAQSVTRPVRGYVSDAAREGVEELLQGGTGQLIGNAAQQAHVDPRQDVLSGVGTQAGAGGVLGVTSSGAVKAPGGAAQAVSRGVSGAAGVVDRRSAEKLAEAEGGSPASVRGLAQRSVELSDDRDKSQKLVEASRRLASKNPETASVVGRELGELVNSPVLYDLPGSVSGLPVEHRSKFSAKQSRAEAADVAAGLLSAESDPGTQVGLALVLSDLLEPVRRFRELPSGLGALASDPEAMGTIREYQSVLADIESLPSVERARAKMAEVLAAEANRSPRVVAAQAVLDPSLGGKVSSAEVEQVLTHAQPGTLTESQRAALTGSLALLRAREALESSRDPAATRELMERHLRGDRNRQTTGRQATVEVDPAHTEDGKYSARAHVDRVIRSMMSGNTEQARAYLDEFGNFARHYQNKVGALSESVRRGGTRVSYQQYVGNGKFVDSRKNPKNYKHKDTWVNLKSAASVTQARSIGSEAALLAELHEGLRQAYPELGAEAVARGTLELSPPSTPKDATKPTQGKPKKAEAAPAERRVEPRAPEADSRPVQPRGPTSAAIENLRGRLQGMNLRDRARLVGTDYVTGLRTRASWEESPRSGRKVMVLTSTAVKPINDDPNGGHDVTNDLLRVIGVAVGKVDPDAARGGTNFILETDRPVQDVLDEVRRALPDPDIELTAGVGETLEDAFQDEKGTTDRMRAEGKLPQRGQTKFDLRKLPGMKFSKTRAQEKLSQQTVDRVRKLSSEEYESGVLQDPVTPGVLSGVGWRLVPRKAFVASIDLKGLKKLNDLVSQEFGNEYLRVFSETGLKLGGAALDFAHLSGDEYAVQADSEQEVWDFLNKLRAYLQEKVRLKARNDKTGLELEVIPDFRRDVGTSYGEADRKLNAAKRLELQAAEAAAKQQAPQDGVGGGLREDAGGAAGGVEADRPAGGGEVGPAQEVTPEPAATPAPKTAAERFPDLFQVPGKVRNFFSGSQRLRPDSVRTSGTDHPLGMLRNAIKTQDGIRELLGAAPRGSLTPEVLKAYQGHLSGTADLVGASLVRSLRSFLRTPYSKGDPRTMGELLRSGSKELTTSQRGKALNLVEAGEGGKLEYNSNLLQGAVLAALQWHLSSGQRNPESRPDEVAQELGYQTAEEVPGELVSLLRQGQSLPEAKQSMASYVRRFWGVRPDPAAPMGFAEAIPEAMAAEALQALEAAGLLTVSRVTVHYDKDGELVYPFRGTKEEAKEAGLTPKVFERYVTVGSDPALDQYPELLEELVVMQPEFASYYGDDVPPVADRQLSNSQVQLSEETKTALRNMQAQEFYLNLPLAEGMLALDEQGVVELFGNPLPADAKSKYNKAHLESLESQNVSLRGAFRELRRLVSEMRNLAGGAGPGTLAKKYQYAVNSVNRIMMLGAHNPQANKFMREMILPTWSTLDMTDESGDHYRYFMHAFAQAMKQKVHQNSMEENVKWSREAIRGPLAPALAVLSSWLRSGGAFPARAYRDALEQAGVENDYLAAMALTEVARLQGATPEQRRSFRTPLYLESDGMTNGPFNSMGLLAVGEVTEDDIRNWRRGGLSVGSEPKTADQLRRATGKVDLYKEGMNAAQVDVNAQLRQVQKQKDGRPILGVASAMFAAMELLLDGEVSWDRDKGEWQFERGLGKNPSTVLVYGAGNPGIANKLVSRVTAAFYEKLSAVSRTGGTWEESALEMFPKDPPAKAVYKAERLRRAVDVLSGTKVVYSGKTRKFHLVERAEELASQRVDESPQDFQFNKEELERMQTNMLFLLVNPMKEGIRRVLGPSVFNAGDLLVKATNIQSTVAREVYLKRISRMLAEKEAHRAEKYEAEEGLSKEAALKRAKSEVSSEFLSRNELQSIWDDLRDVMPLVEADGQRFLISKSSLLSARGKGTNEYSRALDDSMRTEPYAEGIAPAGVTARPYLTIGMGDARMVRKVFEGGLAGAMQVFDGINIPVDKIPEYGSKINGAAMEAWQGSVFSSVLKSFEKFWANQEVQDSLRDEEVLKALEGQKIQSADLQNTPAELARYARMQEARNRALSKFAKSMDQMAGTYRPHVTEGVDLGSATDAEVRDAINREVRRALEELSPAGAKKPELPGKTGVLHPSGASVYHRDTMPQFLSWLRDRVTKPEASILAEMVKSGAIRNTRVVVGTREQVEAYQDAEGLSQHFRGDYTRDYKGYYVPTEDIVYLMNPQVETAVHELVHVATWHKVAAHFEGKHNPVVARLEELMHMFLAQDFQTEDVALKIALEGAKYQINHDLGTGGHVGRTHAVNEFVAWALANRHLYAELDKPGSALSRLAGLAREAVEALVRLVTGRRATPQDSSFMAQVRFNTALLVRSPAVESMVGEVSAAHASVAGVESNRLTELADAFGQKVARYLSSDPAVMSQSVSGPLELAKETARRAQSAFDLGPQAADVFQLMVLAFATEASVNPQAMTEAQELYEHFLGGLSQEDFLTGLGDERNDLDQATRKFEFVSGHTQSAGTDPSGRSTLLPSFLALAAVDDGFRALLGKKQAPGKSRGKTVAGELASLRLDSALEVAGQVLMDGLQERLSGTDHPENVRAAVDQLTQSVIRASQESRLALVDRVSPTGLMDSWNDKVAGMLARAGEAAGRTGARLGRSGNPVARGAATVLKAVSILSSEQDAAVAGEEVLRQLDKHPGISDFFKDLVADMVGRTGSQAGVYDMVKRVRALVAQTRQAYRENVPSVIGGKFKTEPTAAQWDTMYRVMGRFDLASLLDSVPVPDALRLAADPRAVSREVSRLEADLGRPYLEKINQYVNFVTTGERGTNLLRNAYAISELLGEPRGEDFVPPTPGTVRDIDQLITLKLLESLPASDRAQFSRLLDEEPEGLEFALNYLKGQRKSEMAKASQGMAKYNHYKGLLPSELRGRGHVVVVDDSKHAHMVQMGYERRGAYRGSSVEERGASKSYWYSPEGGVRTTFNQGIAQNVQGTAYGVRTETGVSLENNAGVVTDPAVVAVLAKRLRREAPGPETLSPVYDQDGTVVAFERSLDPGKTRELRGEQHLGKMVGEWKGRQVEEAWASKVNEELLNHLHGMWLEDDHKDRYVNLLGDDLDPVVRDAVSIMPWELKRLAEEKFGAGQFMVRRNLLNSVVGYRNASVGDLWTGTSRWSPKLQQELRKALMAVPGLGSDAYRKLVWAERNWQAAMAAVRTNIVVRSLVVPAANFLSGVLQLNVRGIPLLKTLRSVPAKVAELEFYSKTMARKIDLEAERFAHEGDVVRTRKIDAQLTALGDSLRRLSIWPLVEAGEFSTISDVGQTAESLGTGDDTLVERLTRAVDALPPGLRDLARQGYMARDTALFRTMQKSVQYSDFVMKAIYYDHLKAEGQSTRAALASITEEFNNYDMPPGRDRGYVESVGLAWFLNYKIRATKVGLSMARKNPLNLLLYTLVPHPASVGIPGTDNLVSSLMELSLGRSFGPGMATNPVALNPWYNLVAD